MSEVTGVHMPIRKRPGKKPEARPAPPEAEVIEPTAAAADMTDTGVMFRETTGLERPAIRPLKVYAFDPSEGRYRGNEMTLNVKYERLLPGPIGRRVAVIDYDGANKVFYKPVELDKPEVLIRNGLTPSESNPYFHQQMVYAVVSETIEHFEAALGRRVHWRLDERVPDARGVIPRGPLPGDIRRLNLYPHAMISANAAYTPSAKGILFGYFRASETNPGRNLPGQTVFTCLSHDIIVHETTHAVLDGIRTYFSEMTNPDVAAFHEAFADLAALFRHFSHKEALLDTIQKTGGKLYKYQLQPDAGYTRKNEVRIQAEIPRDNPLIGLAQQFGEARGTGKALRSALSDPPDPSKMKDRDADPHDRGAILVSAVFDAYFSIYLRQTEDLFRLFRAGGGNVDSVELPGPLANLLAAAASRWADHFFKICVRAIDYCPVVDITFGDYLRAVITADREMHPVDDAGVRDAFMQAFRLRGIVPETARYFSEDALCWQPVPPGDLHVVDDLIFGDPNGLSRAEQDHNGDILRAYAKKYASDLGLRSDLRIDVPSFHPMFRVDPDGSLRIDMVVEMSQIDQRPFDPKRPQLGTFPVRGGSTLLIRKPSWPLGAKVPGNIAYVIHKHLHADSDGDRERRQRDFWIRRGLVEGTDPRRFQLDFNLLHGGM